MSRLLLAIIIASARSQEFRDCTKYSESCHRQDGNRGDRFTPTAAWDEKKCEEKGESKRWTTAWCPNKPLECTAVWKSWQLI